MKVEVEYVRGGKRTSMRKQYADVLVKLGAVRLVETTPAPEQKPARTYQTKPAAPLVTRQLKAETPAEDDDTDDEESDGKKAKAKKRSRTYKRRDMQADDGA